MTTCWKACWMATGGSAAQVSGVPEAHGVLSNEATGGILHRGVFFICGLRGNLLVLMGMPFLPQQIAIIPAWKALKRTAWMRTPR